MGTGSYKVGELAAQDSVLKDLDIGTKYLENTSAGTIALQSKQAYGEWEFDLYKSGIVQSEYVTFISDRIGSYNSSLGYHIRRGLDGELFLRRASIGSTSVLFQTADSYIDINTWYRLKVTRTTDGEFTVLIKGGSFTATIGYDGWTLVQPTGESLSGDPLVYTNNPVTDNTYTTSEYLVADLDAGDKITNLLLTDQVKQ